eukprot:TRINITY_DN113302_c0_g1_i1.p1 TRINITY_DN113302_c0_g1~~TRINITY_DN113302_c0_g1_i1.p1  ORF type:complete len:150 (+),score=31.35 TRINITY_DN113302_c0_g1_i1:23-472(+)
MQGLRVLLLAAVSWRHAVAGQTCQMPKVRGSPPRGACRELLDGAHPLEVPDGGRCTAWCASGYTASEEALECRRGQFIPASFECVPTRVPAVDVDEQMLAEAPEELPISRCMEDPDFCGKQRLHYVTHLAQAGDWEGLDDSSWRPKWPP